MIELIVEEIISEKNPNLTAGMECQECGKQFRAKLKTLEFGKTKCPKCKSTDLDFAYGAKNETNEENEGGTSIGNKSVDMNVTGRPKKRKTETFKVSDGCFHKFRNGKIKFERWSRYLDLEDASQKKIYDFAKRNHRGNIILQNATTGAVRGIRYNRTGGGQWGKIQRVKEQFFKSNDNFSQLDEDVLDILRNIVKNKQYQKVKFADKKSATVDGFTASAMVQVYDALNKDNQSKFKEMINKNLKGFMAMQSFAMKQTK